jgi:hypothetical protein
MWPEWLRYVVVSVIIVASLGTPFLGVFLVVTGFQKKVFPE